MVCGIGRIDFSGRIADRAVTTALGWRAGDRLTLTADAGVVTARRDPGGASLRRQGERASPPDPRAAAGDEGAGAFKFDAHAPSPISSTDTFHRRRALPGSSA